MAGLGAGDGPLSVRVRPSSIKHDCDRRTTSTGEGAGERTREVTLDTGASTDTPAKDQGPGMSLPDPDAGHPLHGEGGHHSEDEGAPRCQASGANGSHAGSH